MLLERYNISAIQTIIKKQKAKTEWLHEAMDSSTPRITDNTCRTRSTSSRRSGVVRLAIGTTQPTYSMILMLRNPRLMCHFY